MDEQTRRVESDPVLAGWQRFRGALQGHARLLNAAAVIVWVVLVILTIIDHWHAYLGIATVFFVLSMIVSLAAPPRDPGNPAAGSGLEPQLPDTAALPEFLRRRKARRRSGVGD